MELAVELADESKQEERTSGDLSPKVGAVIVKDDAELSRGYRGMTGAGDHAEYGAITNLSAEQLSGAVLYTTLEPCTERRTKTACVTHILKAGITKVYIGSYDPNPVVYRLGWKLLRDAGVDLFDFDTDLRDRISKMNARFVDQYRRGEGDSGHATFDYKQNGGVFEIAATSGMFKTKWGGNPGGMHAYGTDGHVALARYAREFDEIDDPAVFENPDHVVEQNVGEISVFPSSHDWLLVRVDEIKSRGAGEPTAVSISWEARQLDESIPN